MTISERARLGVAVSAAAACAVAGGAAPGCAGNREPEPKIVGVMPASAYSNFPIPLVISGGPFRPLYDIDISTGQETTELGAFTIFLSPSGGAGIPRPAESPMWVNTSQLSAQLPRAIPAGPYDVEVRDPRGVLAVEPAGFVSLGPDTSPPAVTIEEPVTGTIVNDGAEVPVAVIVDDGMGSLSSVTFVASSGDSEVSGTCTDVLNTQRTTCRFVFVVPTPTQDGQPLTVVVTAKDTAKNATTAETTLAIGVAPVVGTFAPIEGPAAGGTTLSITGQHFIAGTQVLVGGDLLQPGGGMVMSDTLIVGTTLPHDPGQAKITVRTGAISVDAAGTFDFVGQPQVRAVTPTEGPFAGCTPITIVGENFRDATRTLIRFGADFATGAPLQCPTVVSQNRIEGFTPAGAGAVSIFAGDPVGGVGGLPLAFTYLDLDAPDAGPAGLAPAACPCGGGPP